MCKESLKTNIHEREIEECSDDCKERRAEEELKRGGANLFLLGVDILNHLKDLFIITTIKILKRVNNVI